MQDELALPERRPRAPGLDHGGAWTLFAQRGPDVRLQAGAVPGHRDQRRRDRRPGHELPGLRRAVAPGRVGARGPRRRDGRVLALAHQPLRHRVVLDRHPAARPAAGPGVPRARRAGGRAGRAAGSTVARADPRTPRSACSTPPAPSGAWPSSHPSPTRTAQPRPATGDPRAFHRIYEAFYRGAFDAGVGVRVVHDEQLLERSARRGRRRAAGARRARPAGGRGRLAPLAPGLRGRGRPSRAGHPHRLRRRRGPSPHRRPSRRCWPTPPGSRSRSSPTCAARWTSAPPARGCR